MDIIQHIQKELKKYADPKIRQSGKRFFKEEIKSYGMSSTVPSKIATAFYTKYLKKTPKKEIFSLCEALWQHGYIEEDWIACNWSYKLTDQYEPKDFTVFERWLSKYVNNWASCDTLCNHTVGDFVMMYPNFVEKLKKWAKSKNRWVKRGAAVTLIIPARKGLFLNDVFEIADTLLLDEDDLVQKGYGWMLKAASQTHQKEVFKYVLKNKAVMPRTALRYAIEKMPTELKKQAMAK